MNSKSDFSHHSGSELDFELTKKRLFIFIVAIGFILISVGLATLRLEHSVTGDGKVYANEEWYVYAPEEETIEKVIGRIGNRVEVGAPLFQLKKTNLELEIVRREEVLLRTQEELSNLEWDIKLAEIRPSNLEVLTAGDRLAILQEIQEIQNTVTNTLENLADQRAIRSLEYYRQKVENLRTQMDSINTKWWHTWQESGLWDLEKARLKARHEHLSKVCENLQKELDLLRIKRDSLVVTAPIAGEIVEIFYRHSGMKPQKGDRLAKIAVLDGKYRVRTYLDQRNYDLVKVGMPVRMESEVFNSILEGYVYGTVARVGQDSNHDYYQNNPEDIRYEVWIDIESSPYPLLLGSTLKVDILMGKVSLLEILLKRPDNRRSLKISDSGDSQP